MVDLFTFAVEQVHISITFVNNQLHTIIEILNHNAASVFGCIVQGFAFRAVVHRLTLIVTNGNITDLTRQIRIFTVGQCHIHKGFSTLEQLRQLGFCCIGYIYVTF